MATFKVDTDEIAAKAAQTAGHAEELLSQLSVMNGQLEALAATWQGQGQAAFEGLWQQWKTGYTQTTDALTGISRQLYGAGQTYNTSEEQVTSIFSG